MMPAPDHLDEIINIDFSRIDRAVRDRWAVAVSIAPGIEEIEAARLRDELSAPDRVAELTRQEAA